MENANRFTESGAENSKRAVSPGLPCATAASKPIRLLPVDDIAVEFLQRCFPDLADVLIAWHDATLSRNGRTMCAVGLPRRSPHM